ncbi:MAG: AI-2E family transporter [Alphaproteobacteria bacterium]
MTETKRIAITAPTLRRMTAFSVVGLFALALLAGAYVTRDIAVPLVGALVLFLVLRPVLRFLARFHIPRPVSAALILILIVGAAAVAFGQLREPAVAWIDRAPQIAFELRYKLADLREPVEQATRASEQVERITNIDKGGDTQEVVVKGPSLMTRVSGNLWQVVGGIGLMFALLYFLLAAGETFFGRLIEAAPNLKKRERTIQLFGQIEGDVAGYLGTTAAINVALGVVVGIAFFFAGLPNAGLWGVMVAVLNFIPYLGALVGVVIVAVVSVISFDTTTAAILPPLIYATLSTLEGQFITPSLLGHRLAMNPIFVFLTVVFWFWMWGIPGALLAVPLLVCLRAFCANIDPLTDVARVIGSESQRHRNRSKGHDVDLASGHVRDGD